MSRISVSIHNEFRIIDFNAVEKDGRIAITPQHLRALANLLDSNPSLSMVHDVHSGLVIISTTDGLPPWPTREDIEVVQDTTAKLDSGIPLSDKEKAERDGVYKKLNAYTNAMQMRQISIAYAASVEHALLTKK